jgi:uncharacterized membrane protein
VFHVALLLLSCVILAGWFGARTNVWASSTGASRQLAALFQGDGSVRGRGYLLVGLMSLVILGVFFAAICIARYRLEGTEATRVAAAVVCIDLLALVDLTCRLIAAGSMCRSRSRCS